MTVFMVLILCGSGYLLLLGECKVEGDKYATFNNFDHLGGYTQTPQKPQSPQTQTQQPLGTQARFQQRPYANQSSLAQLFTSHHSPSINAHPQLQAPPHSSNAIQASASTTSVQVLPQPQPLQAPQVVTSSPAPHENFSRSPHDTPKNSFQSLIGNGAGQTPNAMMRVPLWRLSSVDPGLARRLGISTFMMGSVLYGLSLLPALIAVGVTSGVTGVGPLAGLLGGLGRKRKKRSSPPSALSSSVYKFREMPFLDNRSTRRFLSLAENTMELRKIGNPLCKKYYVCKVYKAALGSGHERPSLADFETAVIDTFGIAAERTGFKLDLIPSVKMYIDSALVGMTKGNCTKLFPCSQPFFRYFPVPIDKNTSHQAASQSAP